MRYNLFIISFLAIVTLKAEVQFAKVESFPDLHLELAPLAKAIPEPLELPKADSYLCTEEGSCRVEDRFNVTDLWCCDTIRARWRDEKGNRLIVAMLNSCVPADSMEEARTRAAFYAASRPLEQKDVAARNEAVAWVAASFDLMMPIRMRHEGYRNFRDICEYPTTNDHVCVVAFRPRTADHHYAPPWYVVLFIAAPEEDPAQARERFMDDFLPSIAMPAVLIPEPIPRKRKKDVPSENEYLFRDIRRNVVNYAAWHVAESADTIVVDDFEETVRPSFVNTFTNDIPRLRKNYARVCPSPLTGTIQSAVARAFRNRADYLAYVGEEQAWSAAVWSPIRRELVMFLPEAGTEELLRTAKHEAFHQYLTYAAALVQAAPWFNEGHAELFEKSHFDEAGEIHFDSPIDDTRMLQARADDFAELLPGLLQMDYEEFYAGTDEARRSKYLLAWSIAYFLEVGASEVRFKPFEKTRADYMASLVRTRSQLEATKSIFTTDKLNLFVSEWRKFWKTK